MLTCATSSRCIEASDRNRYMFVALDGAHIFLFVRSAEYIRITIVVALGCQCCCITHSFVLCEFVFHFVNFMYDSVLHQCTFF